MLHVLWKTKGVPAEDDPTAEEIRYTEVMKEQRESLIEKLVEYAVGIQSNTVEGVKRAVSYLEFFETVDDIHLGFQTPTRPSRTLLTFQYICPRWHCPPDRFIFANFG